MFFIITVIFGLIIGEIVLQTFQHFAEWWDEKQANKIHWDSEKQKMVGWGKD